MRSTQNYNAYRMTQNFGGRKLWRIGCEPPNPPKFSTTKNFVLYSTMLNYMQV